MANKMIDKYKKYWDDSHTFLAVVVVLDPRYKVTLIKNYYMKLHGKHGLEMVEKVKNHCCDLLTIYESKLKKKIDVEPTISSRSPPTYLSRGVYHSLSDYEVFLDQEKKGKTSYVKSELDNYLEEEQLPRRSEEFDILAWWKTNGLKYTTLQAIAKDVLVVPMSTVASESTFSTSGQVLSNRKNSLSPKTLESLMCSQSWLTAMEGEDVLTIDDEDSDGEECITEDYNA
ncbi:zinc finger BED domain-containing protein RICESLEEPER 3-like [Apium graveolens]|uniref:zinc finger BED domain-containing protein RICESLEEPER 3-like n=1 Tax=Apium graveolens TaxID=4045 RepID=UPI003D79749E